MNPSVWSRLKSHAQQPPVRRRLHTGFPARPIGRAQWEPVCPFSSFPGVSRRYAQCSRSGQEAKMLFTIAVDPGWSDGCSGSSARVHHGNFIYVLLVIALVLFVVGGWSAAAGRCSSRRRPRRWLSPAGCAAARFSSSPPIWSSSAGRPACWKRSRIKRKMFFEYEGAPYHCLDVDVSKPTARGGQTLVRIKMRNLLTRAVFDRTFKAGERFSEPDLARSRLIPLQRRRRLPFHGSGRRSRR